MAAGEDVREAQQQRGREGTASDGVTEQAQRVVPRKRTAGDTRADGAADEEAEARCGGASR